VNINVLRLAAAHRAGNLASFIHKEEMWLFWATCSLRHFIHLIGFLNKKARLYSFSPSWLFWPWYQASARR
jgi:hypothetical protein